MSRYGKTMSQAMLEVNEINDELLGEVPEPIQIKRKVESVVASAPIILTEDDASDKALRDKQNADREARHAARMASVNKKETDIKKNLRAIKDKGKADHDAILKKEETEVDEKINFGAMARFHDDQNKAADKKKRAADQKKVSGFMKSRKEEIELAPGPYVDEAWDIDRKDKDKKFKVKQGPVHSDKPAPTGPLSNAKLQAKLKKNPLPKTASWKTPYKEEVEIEEERGEKTKGTGERPGDSLNQKIQTRAKLSKQKGGIRPAIKQAKQEKEWPHAQYNEVEYILNKKKGGAKPSNKYEKPEKEWPHLTHYNEVEHEAELTEAETEWKVTLKGLPDFYVPGGSAGQVRAMLRKQVKRPDDILNIVRSTKAAKKADFRDRIAGKEADEVEEELDKNFRTRASAENFFGGMVQEARKTDKANKITFQSMKLPPKYAETPKLPKKKVTAPTKDMLNSLVSLDKKTATTEKSLFNKAKVIVDAQLDAMNSQFQLREIKSKKSYVYFISFDGKTPHLKGSVDKKIPASDRQGVGDMYEYLTAREWGKSFANPSAFRPGKTYGVGTAQKYGLIEIITYENDDYPGAEIEGELSNKGGHFYWEPETAEEFDEVMKQKDSDSKFYPYDYSMTYQGSDSGSLDCEIISCDDEHREEIQDMIDNGEMDDWEEADHALPFIIGGLYIEDEDGNDL